MCFRRIFIELLIAAIFVSVSLFAYRTWLHPGAQSMRLTMNQKKWLDGYSGETTQQLIAFEGEYRVDSIVLAFEQAIGQKSVRAGETALTADERIVVAIEALEREVNNGGYSQFFINSSREYTSTIVDSLTRIGCPKTAEITEAAVRALGLHELSDASIELEMEKEDPQRHAALQSCDQRYFKESEPIADHLFAYIKTHQDTIRL